MLTLRLATSSDEDFIRAHAYRLLEFGPPEWRAHEHQLMTQADIKYNIDAVRATDPDSPVFIAVDKDDKPCGFIHVTLQADYYTGERMAHLIDIVVTADVEGMGVGKFLMQQAEKWALEKNSRWITLNAFEANSRARSVYEKLGYKKEWTRYLKPLQ